MEWLATNSPAQRTLFFFAWSGPDSEELLIAFILVNCFFQLCSVLQHFIPLPPPLVCVSSYGLPSFRFSASGATWSIRVHSWSWKSFNRVALELSTYRISWTHALLWFDYSDQREPAFHFERNLWLWLGRTLSLLIVIPSWSNLSKYHTTIAKMTRPQIIRAGSYFIWYGTFRPFPNPWF